MSIQRKLYNSLQAKWASVRSAILGIALPSRRLLVFIPVSLALIEPALAPAAIGTPPRTPDETVNCEILVVGGGLAGAATAYEALLAGRTVCMTEITDWVGGQISSQGTSALDEGKKQRSLLHFPNGYQELRRKIEGYYRRLNPGECWVSQSCFIPAHAHNLLFRELQDAARKGRGKFKWFPSTVIKELEISTDGKMIEEAIGIQHAPAFTAPPLNTKPLSQTIKEAYRYQNSPQFAKKIIRFIPQPKRRQGPADWYVIEATETGEIIALADIPYRLGLDPRSFVNPSSPTDRGDPYCTQGFTYTFAMEQTKVAQPQRKPRFYRQYEPYYSYGPNRNKANFDYLFTYRRIWSPIRGTPIRAGGVLFTKPTPGDISMQNWVWGNDYRPGTIKDNLIYTREQLQRMGQLSPGGWMGGLRREALGKAEELALGYYYWLVAGNTDSQLGYGVKKPYPNHRFLSGLDSPMGTVHGLSKYPYIREARRIIGRPSSDYKDGFSINEIDISTKDYWNVYYRNNLSPRMYRDLWKAITRLENLTVSVQPISPYSPYQFTRRTRSTTYPDSVGIAHYAIDFHPCMTLSPPETPGNTEREGVRQGHGFSHPAQIPLRAIIPQKIDNLLVAGKSIATSNIAAAAYRVHSFEWSVGAAAGTTAAFALEQGILPYQLVDDLPRRESKLQQLRQRLEKNGNPTAFPSTLIVNLD